MPVKLPKYLRVQLMFAALAVAAGTLGAEGAGEFTIAERGKAAACAVVVPDGAGASFIYAAEEFCRYTEKMTGVKLPVSPRSRHRGGRAVVLAPSGDYGGDGFRLHVGKNGALYVTGGRRGALGA